MAICYFTFNVHLYSRNKLLEVESRSNETVKEIKQKSKLQKFRLYLDTKALLDDQTMMECGITSGVTITAINMKEEKNCNRQEAGLEFLRRAYMERHWK
nr:PREDICTED: uncharacterized protein LOC106701942 isoform X2 [Latimeria chalumnae]|eukprot:XP_014339455.1 PREDICTED: uncharacterized protein LOC106701942 isoform X2 [Latimeria chalumnae]